EQEVLQDMLERGVPLLQIERTDTEEALRRTLKAFEDSEPGVFQAYLRHEEFAGWSDFILQNADGRYQIWDTKLARKTKPYFTIQLSCYWEMLSAMIGQDEMSDFFGVILGTKERVEFRQAEFADYYRNLKDQFLTMHTNFRDDLAQRPEPMPRADHRRWTSHAEQYFKDTDHLVQVAGITVGNIKKLHDVGITRMEDLATAEPGTAPKISADTFAKLTQQARLQVATRELRAMADDPTTVPPLYEVLPPAQKNGLPSGLGRLPLEDPYDVFFDLEGYPLVVGGLEYLWGAAYYDEGGMLTFRDWWAHNSVEEKKAFEDFIDWVYLRWKKSPTMHIYHYAAYEVSVVRRLSTRYASREDEVDDLLRNNVFVDLYQIVHQGLRIGEDSYSIKRVERLYRPRRSTDVATAGESIVEYARWLEAGEPRSWQQSQILKRIRDYNEDDCVSTAELAKWLRTLAKNSGIDLIVTEPPPASTEEEMQKESERKLNNKARRKIEDELRNRAGNDDALAGTLADLIDFHRREQKPIWWSYFDRLKASDEQLWQDASCVANIVADGGTWPEKKSSLQVYSYNSDQEFKLTPGEKTTVKFTSVPKLRVNLHELDPINGTLTLKVGNVSMETFPNAVFPTTGSLIPYEDIDIRVIQRALTEVCSSYPESLNDAATALLMRRPPKGLPQRDGETAVDAAVRITKDMDGDCLIIQGPPGTGKTYTAARVISALLDDGMNVGIVSNGHKAIMNLIRECGTTRLLRGCKVGGDPDDEIYNLHKDFIHVKSSTDARDKFNGGLVGGTAWLFTRNEWVGELDYLFIDEAGQVSLANAIAMSQCTRNIVLMGDQMQLEQPTQGAHPGYSALSVLQYYLLDEERSIPERPVFHPVVAPEAGLFLGTSRRMHRDICDVVSDLMYEGRLHADEACNVQRVHLPEKGAKHITIEHGIVFSPIEHDGNTQSSIEEVDRVVEIFNELEGRLYTDKAGNTRPLSLKDFLFISPYNAQVRALKTALGEEANVGSVDKFQGQEAPVCILSFCSSFGEYGSRGLGFILDSNRVNVAISRAQCLFVAVGDPRIASTPVKSIDDMRLVNAYCRLQVTGYR
ncbi:MAG: TM0106 family RecB-like putative nuclease, partial [Candidatus Kapabacteria bacterium]|nr:TM0106 family RecB-like putative nuclease [Candidatus Kapabacteria bacterium]